MTNSLWLALGAETIVASALLTVAADMVAHKRVEQLGGVNVWGYRGPVLRQKPAHETRIAVTGGDLAFGWGVAPTETLAAYVRQGVGLELEVSGSPRVVTAVDLGARGLAPADYAGWITRFATLRPDAICLVLDPPGHAPGGGGFLPDRSSLAFTMFGYSPILPLVLQEKGKVAHSRLLRAAGDGLDAIDRALGAGRSPGTARVEYVEAIAAAVRAGLHAAPRGVVVVVPAPLGGQADGSAIAGEIASRFSGERRVRVVDLGEDAALRSRELRLDDFNLSAGGHSRAARRVAPALLELLR